MDYKSQNINNDTNIVLNNIIYLDPDEQVFNQEQLSRKISNIADDDELYELFCTEYYDKNEFENNIIIPALDFLDKDPNSGYFLDIISDYKDNIIDTFYYKYVKYSLEHVNENNINLICENLGDQLEFHRENFIKLYNKYSKDDQIMNNNIDISDLLILIWEKIIPIISFEINKEKYRQYWKSKSITK